jgi:hypothetical protein
MSHGTQVMKAVLRKDFLQLWPVVALAGALLFLRNIVFPLLTLPMPALRTTLEIANGLACCTLLVAVIQQDALTGVRHDWFTRPIPRGSLFAAKLIFIVVAITVPADLSVIVGSLLSGHSWSEALIEGSQFSLNWIGPLLILSALTTLTNTLLKAAATILIVLTSAALLVPVTMIFGPDNDVIFGSGVGWITELFYFVLLLAASGGVLWIQYARRDQRRAILIVMIGTALAVGAPLFLTQRQVFGVQKMFSSAADEQKIGTTLVPGCFSSLSAERAGPNAVGFTSTLDEKVPPGSLLLVDAARLRYVDRDGRTLTKLKPAFTRGPVLASGSRPDSHHWLLPRAAYEQLAAQKAHAQLSYSFSLLEPTVSADLEANGSRRYIDGLGYCGAKVNGDYPGGGRAIRVDCLKRGAQPAQVSVTVKGEPGNRHSDTEVDFRPSWLELLTVRRWQVGIASEQPSTVPTVTLTAFEARAHVDRTFTVPGLLGGEQCVP